MAFERFCVFIRLDFHHLGEQRAIGRRVSRHDWCMYDEIDDGGILDVVVVNTDGIELYADNLKRYCAVWKELLVGAGGELVSIMIFGCDNWMLIKGCIFTGFVNWHFAWVLSLFVTFLATFSHGRLLLLAICVCGILNMHEELVVMPRHGHRMVTPHLIAGGSVPVDVG